MVGWHHGLNGQEFEQILRDGEGQGRLACGSSWCCKESDMTARLNNNNFYNSCPGSMGCLSHHGPGPSPTCIHSPVSSITQSCPTPCHPKDCSTQASLSISNSRSLLKLMSIESVMPSNHLILCRPLLLLPSIFPSIRVFSEWSVLCIRWPKYRSFSFSISPSNEYAGLISFRMNWFDLLAVQGTLKRLPQHHSSKASILGCSVFSRSV